QPLLAGGPSARDRVPPLLHGQAARNPLPQQKARTSMSQPPSNNPYPGQTGPPDPSGQPPTGGQPPMGPPPPPCRSARQYGPPPGGDPYGGPCGPPPGGGRYGVQ